MTSREQQAERPADAPAMTPEEWTAYQAELYADAYEDEAGEEYAGEEDRSLPPAPLWQVALVSSLLGTLLGLLIVLYGGLLWPEHSPIAYEIRLLSIWVATHFPR